MKWIAVTSPIGEFTSRSIVRFIHTKLVLHEPNKFIEDYPHRINTLEYLDESLPGSAAQFQPVIDYVKKEFAYLESIKRTEFGEGAFQALRRVNEEMTEALSSTGGNGNLESYWKHRCKLAELFIEASPCDPDITSEQLKAYTEYKNFLAGAPIPDKPIRDDSVATAGGEKWVSVEDRLPECNEKFGDSDYVQCIDGLNDMQFVGWYNKQEDKWRVAHHYSTSEAVEVTHWQPLPAAPSKP